jgi:hypothetical protein
MTFVLKTLYDATLELGDVSSTINTMRHSGTRHFGSRHATTPPGNESDSSHSNLGSLGCMKTSKTNPIDILKPHLHNGKNFSKLGVFKDSKNNFCYIKCTSLERFSS